MTQPDLGSAPDTGWMIARMHELFGGHRLSPAQRRIAQYLLDHPREAVFLSSVDIAEKVGVSQPSVTRFATALGFDGFPEFRSALQSALLARPADQPAAGVRNEIQLLIDAEIRNLETLRDTMADLGPLRTVSAALAASRPLPVIGLRVSAPLAQLFGYFAAKVLPDVRVLDVPGSTLEDGLTRAAETGAEWVLVFALPRQPEETKKAMLWARRVGLTIALVTDQQLNPLAEYADVVLAAPVCSDFAFDSHAAATVLCTALLHTVLGATPTDQQASLDLFETTAEERQIFLSR
ncbi:MurR/RpiR family transcriptional regulator [Amycolatopsis sp. lyj-109]|uniref:MurR/RpiR family transcriptional regulator n=1 Tax=Amycolatopsis sp. lyj-109 TaxID=2789287 RepID=UPI003979E53D